MTMPDSSIPATPSPGARVDGLTEGSAEGSDLPSAEPEKVAFPEAYAEGEGKEALAETHYRKHLETHWGF